MSGDQAAVSVSEKTTYELEFTGERVVPGKTEECLFREHEERYVFAGQYVAGKDVLDVACGTGVGTAFLKEAGARSVWGIDIDVDSVRYARARYPQCDFKQGDATNLGLNDESVDVVVSFETIEHIKDQRKFAIECERVMRPGGVFICSTPNTTIYRWQTQNPFHVHELTKREFVDLVSMRFGDLRLFSQGVRVYPLYFLHQLASRALGHLGLKTAVKNALRLKALPGTMREEFSRGGDVTRMRGVERYHAGWFRQPTYVIVVGRKRSGTKTGIRA